jgi:hypothetical protein
MFRDRQVLKWPKVRHYYFFRAQARPVFFISDTSWGRVEVYFYYEISVAEVCGKKIQNFFWKNWSSKMDFRHFAWAKSCNFLRDDLTHLGDSFKLLITKIGDRPVGP